MDTVGHGMNAYIYFGFYKGENVYYDSDDYDGNGTAH